MYCIRDKQSKLLLGISYSKDGLKYITNKTGRLILFKNAFLRYDGETLRIVGDTRLNPKFEVMEYSMIKHNHPFKDSVEGWYRKVYREKMYPVKD